MSPDMHDSISAKVSATKEEAELESIVSVLGTPGAQEAARTHTLPQYIAKEQGHGTDFLNQAFNRRAA